MFDIFSLLRKHLNDGPIHIGYSQRGFSGVWAPNYATENEGKRLQGRKARKEGDVEVGKDEIMIRIVAHETKNYKNSEMESEQTSPRTRIGQGRRC
eukprot:756347-Hanusia_phi.AAC.2